MKKKILFLALIVATVTGFAFAQSNSSQEDTTTTPPTKACFVDANNNGICDNSENGTCNNTACEYQKCNVEDQCVTATQPSDKALAQSTSTQQCDNTKACFVDENGNGICDNCENGTCTNCCKNKQNCKQNCKDKPCYVDKNGNNICDNCENGTCTNCCKDKQNCKQKQGCNRGHRRGNGCGRGRGCR